MEKKVCIPELSRALLDDKVSSVTSCCSSLIVAEAYLNGLESNACLLFDDSEFSAAFKALRSRLNAMFDSIGDSSLDITDIYCVIERGTYVR